MDHLSETPTKAYLLPDVAHPHTTLSAAMGILVPFVRDGLNPELIPLEIWDQPEVAYFAEELYENAKQLRELIVLLKAKRDEMGVTHD